MEYDHANPGEIRITGNAGNLTTGVAVVADAWKELRAELDLDAGSVELFYDGASIKTTTMNTLGTTPLGAVVLFTRRGPGSIFYDDISATQVPEPASMALFGFGLAAVVAVRRRRVA